MNNPIIFFDGNCNLCNRFIRLLLKLDKNKVFRFISLKSESAAQIPALKNYLIPPYQTVILYKDNRVITRSDAVIEIINLLNYPWKFFRIIKFLPKKMRDWFYELVSQNRYKIFGRSESCVLFDEP